VDGNTAQSRRDRQRASCAAKAVNGGTTKITVSDIEVEQNSGGYSGDLSQAGSDNEQLPSNIVTRGRCTAKTKSRPQRKSKTKAMSTNRTPTRTRTRDWEEVESEDDSDDESPSAEPAKKAKSVSKTRSAPKGKASNKAKAAPTRRKNRKTWSKVPSRKTALHMQLYMRHAT